MSISLSDAQRQAMTERPGQPVEVIDEGSHARFVLVPVEHYERIQALLAAEEVDVRETYAAVSSAFAAAGWDDPELDIYNDYDAHRT
jgi:hypothetical protein